MGASKSRAGGKDWLGCSLVGRPEGDPPTLTPRDRNPQMKARRHSTCSICGKHVSPGSMIGKDHTGRWGHYVCAADDLVRDQINSGETFRSQKRSTWKRR